MSVNSEQTDRAVALDADESPPRASRLYAVAAVLALVGLADAVYLTVEHLTGASVRCTITSGCSEVLGSPYATVGGYPLALFGALAYFTAFSLATLAYFGTTAAGRLLAALVALMFAATLWLLYLQAFVLRAFCQYCLLSAAVTTLLLIVVVALQASKRKLR
ncbi:MAG TPA: vitamin K epoxide reductase family protein [Pyrinomonadaceae bacterium]|nr:vitamin K epoxide reductase family protein [Pyrinomonadaceae bacterium]